MSSGMNCWEFKKCGKNIDPEKVNPADSCPALSDVSSSGINGGSCGGRICWAVKGSFSDNKALDADDELESCINCEFFNLVKEEEGDSFTLLKHRLFKRDSDVIKKI